jgi:small subunit ribosomal protein S9
MSLRTDTTFYGTGRRKTAAARVRIFPGSGKVVVLHRPPYHHFSVKDGKTVKTQPPLVHEPLDKYFKLEILIKQAIAPLAAVNLASSFDVEVSVAGGGPVGQAGAIALGIARALQRSNPELRPALKKPGHLSRDGRAKERKKPGRPGARRRFQFSKR